MIDGLLPGLRDLASQFRPDTCVIQRYTQVVTGDGTSQTWATLATVTCRVSRIGQGGTEGMSGSGAVQAVGQRRVKLPPETDVTPKDRLLVDGVTYEVLDVQKISNEVERTVICREVS